MNSERKELIESHKGVMCVSGAASLVERFAKRLSSGAAAYGDYTNLTRLMAQLLIAESYNQSALFDNESEKRISYISEELKKYTLHVTIKSDGRVKTQISNTPPPGNAHYRLRENPEVPKEDIDYSHSDGNTYYYIKNLNIYLTAEVVNQLNLNPSKVINLIQDELKAEIEKIEKNKPQPEK